MVETEGVVLMRNSDVERRHKLINKLIFLNVYNKEDQQLYNLPLSKLEFEYRRYKSQSHPHGAIGSIQWI